MSKKKRPDKLILKDEMIDVIPPESVRVLVTSDDTPTFKIINKKINTQSVKLFLEHKSTREKVKLEIPIEYLELHKIPYHHPQFPTNTMLLATLDGRPTRYEMIAIIDEIDKSEEQLLSFGPNEVNIIIVKDKLAGRNLGLEVILQLVPLKNTRDYTKYCTHPADIKNLPADIIWRNETCRTTVEKLIKNSLK